MSKTIFSDLQVKAFRAGITPRTKSAQQWFRQQINKMGSINRNELLKAEELKKVSAPQPGDMFSFFYDPKHKDTLPYYDRFPLIIMVDEAPGGFYGLNLHYLPVALRAKFFDALMDTMTNKKYDNTTRLKVSYQMLKAVSKMKYFKVCYKHYLTEHVRSQIVKVEPTEWDIALFLPTQQFVGARLGHIYNKARRLG